MDLLSTSDQPHSQVAHDFSVSVAISRNQKKLCVENQRLRREYVHLKRQREYLEKAAFIPAEDPLW